jgi:hypothetical protein
MCACLMSFQLYDDKEVIRRICIILGLLQVSPVCKVLNNSASHVEVGMFENSVHLMSASVQVEVASYE